MKSLKDIKGIMKYMEKTLSDNAQTKYAFFFTFLFGLSAHVYAFANFTVSHDSLAALHTQDLSKISLGRFGVVIYKFLTGSTIVLPWSSGMISLFLVSISTILICKIFCLKKRWNIILISGILVTNTTVISLVATYMHDLGSDMLALFFSVVAAYVWNRMYRDSLSGKEKRIYIFAEILSVILTLSLYQSYLSVTLVIIIFVLLLDLLEGKPFAYIIKAGWTVSLCILAACLAYLTLAIIICQISDMPMNTSSYNSLSNITNSSISVKYRLLSSYDSFIKTLILNPISSFRYPATALIHIFLLFWGMCFGIKKGLKLAVREKALAFGLIFVTPLAMNISIFLSGFSHDLMTYAIYLFYIPIFILISKEDDSKNASKTIKRTVVMIGMVGLIIFSNIQSANAVYMKKDAERQATISLMTQALGAIAQEDVYQYGKTPIAFLGCPLGQEEIRLNEGNISNLVGNGISSQITYYDSWISYLKKVLNYKINFCTKEQIQELEMRKEVQTMPYFPNKGSVKTIDGVIVVKFST